MKYTKICQHCGKQFETNSPQKIYCNDQHYRPCPVCGKPVAMIDNDFTRPPKCCSSECSKILRQRNFHKRICIECGQEFTPKSGVQLICDREHYRTCEICGNSFAVSRRDIHDNLTVCSPECKIALQRKHNIEKYGVSHPMMLKETRDKLKSTMKAKYGVEHALQNSDISARQQITAYHTNMEHNGVPYACMLPQCVEAQGKIISNANKRIADKLHTLGLQYSFEKRISNMSFDICIESDKTLIEIDPSYTHSTVETHWGSSKDKYYHRDKSAIAKAAGYRCIHIFDWDDVDRIVDSIKPKKSIYARKCTIYKLKLDVANEFLSKYHFQGTCRGQLLCLGLVQDGELYQVMTFGKPRYDKHHSVELLRLCTKPGYTVAGGASRLFKFATENYGLSDIISYCDLSKFSGDIYETIGMQLIRTTPPQEIWSRGNQKITANLLRQRGYDQLFKTNYGKGTSNEQLMIENGWLPVYDCGQLVYEFK